MHRSISTLLTTLLVFITVLPTVTSADTTGTAQNSFNSQATNQPSDSQTSPFSLAYLAYQGYLKSQGIPSNGALIAAIADGTITAQDVMQAAIAANWLPQQTLTDQSYRWALEMQLNGLTQD
jgi:hypothetical protein